MSKAHDPITLEVVRNKLDGIANEMQSTLLRSSFSPIVKEGLDASASLFTTDGETLSQALAVPIHLATLIPVVEALLREFPLEAANEGDIYILNDPYLGGTHLPDIALVMPVFHKGKPIALSAAMTHHQDVGGMTPGSVPTHATEIYQEGVRIPPLKLRDGDVMNETLMKMMRQNVRMAESFEGDLNAQIAACTVGARRLSELAIKHGRNTLQTIFVALLDRSERLTRLKLADFPEGTYTYTEYLDNDGVELDKSVRIQVAVTIKDNTFHCDFTGTSGQVKGPFNCVPSGTAAAACFALRAVTDPNIPTNGGCFRPLKLTLPKGSIVNPREPAPVNARTATIKRIASCVLGALKEAVPNKVPADSGNELLILMLGGLRSNGENYVVGDLVASGSGASHHSDGVDMIETDATNCMNLPVEALEMDVPVRINRFGLRRDSGGPGKHRGGLGCIREYEILKGEVTVTYRGERHSSPAAGSQGGDAGTVACATVLRADGSAEVVPSKNVFTLLPGDRLTIETAGGGGFGNSLERDQDLVETDLKNGKISAVL